MVEEEDDGDGDDDDDDGDDTPTPVLLAPLAVVDAVPFAMAPRLAISWWYPCTAWKMCSSMKVLMAGGRQSWSSGCNSERDSRMKRARGSSFPAPPGMAVLWEGDVVELEGEGSEEEGEGEAMEEEEGD